MRSSSHRGFVALLAISAAVLFACGPKHRTLPIKFEEFSQEKLQDASRKGKGAVVYATADWCGYCEILDQGALSDPAVIEALSRLVRLEIDYTKQTSEKQALLSRYAITGFPTLMFFDAKGNEVIRLSGDADVQSITGAVKKAEG